VPHRLSRLPPRRSRDGQLQSQWRQLHLRPGDHRAGGRGGISHLRNRRAHALLPRGLLGVVRRLHRLWPAHPRCRLLVSAQQVGPPALAPVRQSARALHASELRGLARGLDGAALVLAALALAVLASGPLRVGGLSLERPEDLVVALALIIGARLAVAPIAVPRLAPRSLV